MKWFLTFFAAVLLAGCGEDSEDYNYLMTHPAYLQKAALQCQRNHSPHCDLVNHAANDFLMLVSERRENPEVFDKKIMAAEFDMVAAEKNLQEAGSDAEKLARAKNAVVSTRQLVSEYMAVVAVSSTE